jgi:hypothetical protein
VIWQNKQMTTLHLAESIGRSPLRRDLLLTLATLACFALMPAPNAFGVSPAPDGGYPGNNTAEGTSALFNLTSGISNTAVGFEALKGNVTGKYNTANGADALRENRGAQNTGTGSAALANSITGSYNTADGYGALGFRNGGSSNTGSGVRALNANSTGTENTAVGLSALAENVTGIDNTAVGFKAFEPNRRTQNNIALGHEAGMDVGGWFNHIEIGNPGGFADNYTTRIGDGQFRTFIAGISGTAVAGNTVVVNANGQLGTATSSARFKKEIKPMDKPSEAILALKPVSFQYKSDPKATPQFGLIAEEVAKVNPDLVTRDRHGEIYSVRYEAVNAMLLNEFLKEHEAFLEEQRKVQEQQATIMQLKSTVGQQQKDFQQTAAQLTKRADEQASQLQRVSAQLELSKQAPEMISSK